MTLRSLFLRARALLLRRRVERELDDEFRFHLEMEAEKGVRSGLTPAQAKRAALRSFGGVERFAEATRDVRGIGWIDDLRQDVRFGMRMLLRNPGFSLVVIATLALGIGANAAIFSVVNGVLLRPLAWSSPERLTIVWENDRVTGTVREAASVPDFYDFRERSRAYSSLAMYAAGERNLTGAGSEAERVRALGVSHGIFEVLGVPLLLGRAIAEAEDLPGVAPVALLTEPYWRARFGADGGVIGRTLLLDDQPYTVVGVLAAGADFPDATTQIWIPLQLGPTSLPRANHPVTVIGRLAPGVTVPAAQAEMSDIARQLEEEYPQANSGRGVFVEPLSDVLFGNVRRALYVLLGAVGFVLMIACANVANLLLARGSVRAREVAVRAALGANGGRLTRQFLVEMLLLAGIAGGAGVLLARIGLARLVALMPPDLPRVDQVGIDLRVLAATLVVSVVVAVGIGLVPTLHARRLDVQATLKEEGARGGTATRSTNRLRSGLVVGELALAVVLLVGAGLLVRSFLSLRGVDPGFRADRVLKVEFTLPDARYPRVYDQTYPNWPRTQSFYQELLGRLASLRGVESAALAGHHPLAQGFTNSFVIEGREQETASLGEIPIRPVSAGYFQTVGVRVLRGRAIETTDGAGAPAVGVINEAAARRFFPDTDPVGQRVRFWGTTREIVGVVANERFYGLAEEAPPGLYTPLPQTPLVSGNILIRTTGDPEAYLGAVRDQVRAIDPELALFGASSMESALSQSLSRERFTTLLLALFACIALVMALLGVHGVLSYAVSQRRRELWIRVALGATRKGVITMVVRQGMTLAAFGIGLGVIAALATTRMLTALLHGVTPTDAATLVVVVATIGLASLAASFFPARRAIQIQPRTPT